MATLAKLDNVAWVVDKIGLIGFLRMAAADDVVPLCVSRQPANPAFSLLDWVA